MKIGITGTREGCTPQQLDKLHDLLLLLLGEDPYGYSEFHHGDCVGVDAEGHKLLEGEGYRIVIHPPTDPKHRAFCQTVDWYVREPKPYLDRNKDIVDETDLLIVVPKGPEEQRSGTWSTKRYAEKVGKPYLVIPPN